MSLKIFYQNIYKSNIPISFENTSKLDVGKSSDRNIKRIVKKWLEEKPVAEIARNFQEHTSEHSNYLMIQRISDFARFNRPGRKFQPLDYGTEQLILDPIGPTS